MNQISGLYKGDSIEFECKIGEDITNWKIRCEIYDDTITIKKATANSGGSDTQILVTDITNGVFSIYILKTETTNATRLSNIEIEIETSDEKVYTVYQNQIKFLPEEITWETP